MVKKKLNKLRLDKFTVFVMLIVSMFSLFFVYTFVLDDYSYSEGNYDIFVSTKVIDFLAADYTSEFEQVYCIQGTILGNIVNVTSIEKVKLAKFSMYNAVTEERYVCNNDLGMIHTHPSDDKYFYFSRLDFYTLGESSHLRTIPYISGIYLGNEHLKFYIGNTVSNESILLSNDGISFQKY